MVFLQCRADGSVPPRIETGHGTYNRTFKVIINTFPEHEWLARSLLVESIASHFENRKPWIITKMFQEPIEPLLICKVGYLALDYDGEGIDSFFQFIFLDLVYDNLIIAVMPVDENIVCFYIYKG